MSEEKYKCSSSECNAKNYYELMYLNLGKLYCSKDCIIDDLERELSNHSWTPVSERLPDNCRTVFIWPLLDFGHEQLKGCYYPSTKQWEAFSYDSQGCTALKIDCVTHWMEDHMAPNEE